MRDNLDTVCGYVAIVGRPNVGKSTLLNHILGEKLSITSRKPQTTRHRLLGVKTVENIQTIYVDTPGMHITEAHLLNKFMNKEARRALVDVDVIVFVIEGLKWNAEDQLVYDLITKIKCPIILAVNKVDTLPEKTALLPYCESLALKFTFFEIIPLSATRTINIDALECAVASCLPKSPHYFPETQITDRTPRFRMAEIIREKLVRSLGEELPYSTTVEIEMYKEDKSEKVPLISAIIWVEREGQKPIVIGKNGERLKEIGIRSRKDIEKFIGRQVHLKLWVKVRGGWSDDARALKSLGYIDLE
jgi:GTP-binding protein Era